MLMCNYGVAYFHIIFSFCLFYHYGCIYHVRPWILKRFSLKKCFFKEMSSAHLIELEEDTLGAWA